jgi:hypothetical protein
MRTIPARLAAPYVHADNRGMVICNGPQCVFIAASQLRACAETFEVIAGEGRATRGQGGHVVGGYQVDGSVVLYAGTQDVLLSVQISDGDFQSLREAITSR